MFTALRAVYIPLTRMGRQQTLGKFLQMPPGKKAPPQQSSLTDLWGGKKKKQESLDAERDDRDAKQNEPDATLVESVNASASDAARRSADAMDVDEKPAEPSESAKRKSTSARVEVSSPERPKTKRRKIVMSDEEDEGEASATEAKASASSSAPPSPTPPMKIGPPKRSHASKNSATQKKPDPRPSASVKSKGKRKEKIVPLPEETSGAEEEPEASSAAEDENPDEDEEGEEELEEEEGKVASKNAEAALDRRSEVDVQGGWKVGDPVPYAALAKTFALIEATTKRIEKTSLLTSLLLLVIQRSKKGDTDSLLRTVYLCINRLSPDYIGIELGIGESLLIKAIGESTGRSLAIVKSDLKKEGDLGLVAKNSKNNQKTLFKPRPLSVPFVFSHLKDIALSSGHSSQNKKVSIITKLLAACQGEEAKYIVRSLEGKLRIGLAERTVLVALAHATVLAEQEQTGKRWNKEKLAARLEEGSSILKSVYSELPNYDQVVPALLNVGISKLHDDCKLTPGVPLKPMLAKPTKAIGEVLDRFEGKRFTCEYKYDGERAQVHMLPDGTVGVFSRNSEDMSKKYPDLVEQLPHAVKEGTQSFVLDAEAVAIDRTTGKLMPFQELSKRKRKDVKVEDIQVRVCIFAFDLLFLNGEPLLKKNLVERRELLQKHFKPVDGEFQFARSSDNESTEDIQTFLDESVKDGCEGLMVKMLESEASYYEPSRRSVNWLKLKKDYLAGVGDSLDLVVVGGYYGKGKRTNVYGAFLLACYDSDSEEFQTICKIGTGFSEEMLASHYEALKPLELATARGDVKVGGAKPDVWFEPRMVWEVLTADLSLSPVYTAAMGLIEDRGVSLRFPRFLRVRDDKNADDATGSDQVAEMYERQVLAQGSAKKKKGDGDADDGFW
ncbi:ATP-dependent DNA ligase [Artomyces pyxidatus]|uniref:ATP-dependent DNA ligase n=1 Tax=Artomyces pyxidatus TaxID=48021 RepID=A0ACB8TIK7_9AGAM|nr:ATP-dependent DNA ligase [Artomyces pyxidatus]